MAGNTTLASGTWPYTLAPMGLVPGEPQSVQDLKSNPDNKAGNRTNCLQNKRINPDRFHVPQNSSGDNEGFSHPLSPGSPSMCCCSTAGGGAKRRGHLMDIWHGTEWWQVAMVTSCMSICFLFGKRAGVSQDGDQRSRKEFSDIISFFPMESLLRMAHLNSCSAL